MAGRWRTSCLTPAGRSWTIASPPGQRTETLLQEIEKAVDQLRLQHPSLIVATRVILRVEPTETEPGSRLVRVLGDAIQLVTGNPPVLFGKTGTGDANLVHERLGIPAIAYGPGNDSGPPA